MRGFGNAFEVFCPQYFLLVLFTLLVGSSVMADDGRINHAPYHFGGDTLFCSQKEGCKLLNDTGSELAHWSQDDIASAFAATAGSGENNQVTGEGQGTYGSMQLWAVAPDPASGNDKLCLIGFDEWGKQNNMCFEVTKDWHFEQATLPAPAATVGSVKPVSTDCAVDLAAHGYSSVDGIHYAEGFDIWSTNVGIPVSFLYWINTRPGGLADCNL